MTPLPTEFRGDGMNFRTLNRSGQVVLLAKSKPGWSRELYEVAIVQIHPAQKIMGKDYPERESMPSSESWGDLGWSYPDLEAAKAGFSRCVLSQTRAPKGTFPPTPPSA